MIKVINLTEGKSEISNAKNLKSTQMNLHHILLIIHLISATIWVGGHLFLAIRILPRALREKSIKELQYFKNQYEPFGMPALIVLVVTGIWMAYDYNATIGSWFSFSNRIERVVSVKLILLLVTFAMAFTADRFIFPKLNKKNIYKAAIFIIAVTAIGLAMIILGSFVRYGGI